jgi:hypothetical protein
MLIELRIASFMRFVLLNIVGAEADVLFVGGPIGGKDTRGCPNGLARFELDVVGVPRSADRR